MKEIHALCRTLRLAIVVVILSTAMLAPGAVLWSDFGPILAHDTGGGKDILRGTVRRDNSSSDTLYFKFHVMPISDWATEPYLAGFQLYDASNGRLGVGNGLDSWSYSAFNTAETETRSRRMPGEYILQVDRGTILGNKGHLWDYVTREIEHTIVFKVQYVPGTNALVTVWVSPNLRSGATEQGQSTDLTTHFTANASFNEIHLRHVGGGGGWIFSEMAIATSFEDFVAPAPEQTANISERETGGPPFTFRSWQWEQGLPQLSVNALAQDGLGYLWLGTDDGLTRFDGMHFASFARADGLPSGGVQALLADRDGNLWIGTATGGLVRRHNGRFVTLTKHDGLPDDSILALMADDQNRIWIGTAAGLAVWQNGKLSPAFPEFSGHAITALFKGEKDMLWIGVTGMGVFQCQEGKIIWSEQEAGKGLIKQPHCLLVDNQGQLWVGAGNGYLLCHGNGRWTQHRIPHSAPSSYVKALAMDADGAVWIGSVGDGLLRFWKNDWQVLNAGAGLSDNSIQSLLFDRQGHLWVGARYGLNRQKRENIFTFGSREGLGDGAVQALAEILPGMVWIGKTDDGLYRWDGTNIRPLAFHDVLQGSPQVRTMLTAADGSCWIAGTQGLWHFPQAMVTNAEPVSLPKSTVNALCESQTGALWAGTQEGELWCREHNQWQLQTNCAHPITSLLPGAGSAMWIGTEGAGVLRLHDQTCDQYSSQQGLLSDSIRTLYSDEQGTLWIGTAGGGLSRLRDGRIATFTVRQGLPDNTVSQILEDDAGRLWLGTGRGIAAVSCRSLEQCAAGKSAAVDPQLYGREDGMLSEECSGGFSPAGLKARSGLLCFATQRGLVVIDPHSPTNSSPAPAVIIEQFAVDGVPQAWDSPAGNPPSGSTGSLRLEHGNHQLEIRYTGLNFPEPRRVHFRYQTEGLDSGWIEAGNQRVVTYKYLQAGGYRFRVQACGTDDLWRDSDDILSFFVPPPFWRTWWFITLAATGLLATVAFLVRAMEKHRHQRQMKRLEYEHALERERSRVARDLHDELGARLAELGMLGALANNPDISRDKQQGYLSRLAGLGQALATGLDEIVWVVNPKHDSNQAVSGYLCDYAQEYLNSVDIVCRIDVAYPLPVHNFTAHERHELFRAFKEALTNVVKHSQATEVCVRIGADQRSLWVMVEDNGKGFQSHPSKGDGLNNMGERMKQIGGSFEIVPRPEGGTTATFRIFTN